MDYQKFVEEFYISSRKEIIDLQKYIVWSHVSSISKRQPIVTRAVH